MTLKEEQKKVQKAMNSALSGLKEDPHLAQRVLALAKGEERPMKKKLSAGAVLAIALLCAAVAALAASGWTGITEFLGSIVGGWDVKQDAVVQPIKQEYDGKLLLLTATEAYWAEDGLSIVIKADAPDDKSIPVYEFENGLEDEEGSFTGDYIEIDGQTVKLDDWRAGRDVILGSVRPQGEGWTWYHRNEEGLFLAVTSWAPDAEALKAGTAMTFDCRFENLQTGEAEDSQLTVFLPPMEMQTGHR